MSMQDCPENCNGNGLCTLGRCTCKLGWHSNACNQRNCYNSLVFVDIDILDPQHTYHCQQNGICYDGTCDCVEPYVGKDCSTRMCINNCSNTETETYGDCIEDFPQGHCKCYEWLRRGGDDCSYKFCLNECSMHGSCEDGKCVCNQNYYGEDCSIFVVTVLIGGIYLQLQLAVLLSIAIISYLL
ncbi:hypothetical protein FGO68_gene10893 [Halteria grandinella]|uniref:EGF-like domain-containing protein n=1 Tax=Halteria grandinella TaxID=5974 RepID=A0A8J8T7K0_HALGN|nr:hypothetical protein FGO68_gene10893 [Halteria grandinella]